MHPLEPVATVELFPQLGAELLAVLKGLAADEWRRPTVCTGWSVKDVAAHLLGGGVGRLWNTRDDSLQAESSVKTYDELVSFINQSNDEWVKAARRISPNLLIEFLDLADRRLYDYFKSLKADEPARIEVAWAGEEQSPNWFDIAREYTEKWLHQQHIREAVGQPVLSKRKWLFPVLDAFMRALPHTYRDVAASEGTALSFNILGEAGGEWSLLRQSGVWRLYSGQHPAAVSIVSLSQDTAWRLFTKGLSQDAALAQVQIEGNKELGAGVLGMVAIMA
ncbi:MAG: maleylpyruvate isomerase N-terminal domain-containing protein [Chloroflexi bacterium]|nr:maleylpyruvate isomerase N-terminal domain-containing protein [Chloroflexota bacterium]